MAETHKPRKFRTGPAAKAGVVAESGATPETKPTRRKQRLARLAAASTVSFSLEPEVRGLIRAEAKAAGMDTGHYLQKIIETHIVETADADNAVAIRLRAKRAVIDRAVTLAQDIYTEGRFDEHFILHVMQEASSDPEFAALYETAVAAPEGMEPNKAKRIRAPLNQQLGRLIKKAVGAKSKRNDAGKIARAQVTGEMIATYTLLEKAA